METINKNNLREFLNSDKAILMACIGIAFVFWLFTKLSKDYRSEVTAEITYTAPLGKIESRPPESKLDVSIEGKGWDLLFHSFFGNNTPKINVPLKDTTEQEINMLSIETRMRRFLPSEADILGINPKNIKITLEPKVRKEILIKLVQNVTLAPQQQFEIPIQIFPKYVSIIGPASVVENVNEWKTELLVLNDLSEDIPDGEIGILPFNNSKVTFEPNKLALGIKVETFTEKMIQVPIQIVNSPADSLVINPKFITIRCTVAMKEYDNLTAKSFKAIIDFNTPEAMKGSELTIRLTNEPNGIANLLEYQPKKVEFFVFR